MDALAIILVIVLSLWSITKTIEKLTDKLLENQNKQIELLEEVKSKLDANSDN
jgi:hypothetical protein